MEILKFKSHLSVVFEQVTAPRRHVQRVVVKLKKSIRGTLHGFQAALRNTFEQVAEHLRRAHSALWGLLDRVIERRRRLRQEMRARENELRELLASSLDAIVVTNPNRRFVAANPKALELFGVSGRNLGSFTIDVFFPHRLNLGFDASSSLFMSRRERHSKCKIRRLDGGLRFAECVFVQNFVPFRHLCRLHDVTPQKSGPHLSQGSSRSTANFVNA